MPYLGVWLPRAADPAKPDANPNHRQGSTPDQFTDYCEPSVLTLAFAGVSRLLIFKGFRVTLFNLLTKQIMTLVSKTESSFTKHNYSEPYVLCNK